MTSKQIILEAMKQRGFNQTMLADAAELKRQSNVSEILRSSNMRIDTFFKLLSAMQFEIVVRDKQKGTKTEWKVTLTDDEPKEG